MPYNRVIFSVVLYTVVAVVVADVVVVAGSWPYSGEVLLLSVESLELFAKI